MLRVEMEALQGMDFDIGLTGCDEKELAALFETDDEAKEDDFNVDAELEKPCISQAGDIWHLGKHRVICGDATVPETYRLLLGDTKVNLVCTDPPYMVNLESASGKIKNDTNFDFYDPWQTEGNYQMPIVRRCDVVPERLLGFNYAKCEKEDAECGIHFFIDDYQFERIWNNPRQTIPRLARFRCVLEPDFSLYLDMPMAMKIWNTYRSRMIGQMMQREGLEVIPTLSWAEEETFGFCFDGIELGGVVAVSTVGVARKKDAWAGWCAGMDEALRRLCPSTILCYGKPIEYDFGDVPVRFYKPCTFSNKKKG